MKNFAYNCKFCGRPGIVQADEAGLGMFSIEKWLPRICCNRCGEFMDQKRKCEQAILQVCRIIETCRINLAEEKRKGVETRAKMNLESYTKKYASVVCNYYRVTNVWEQQFADMIFKKPTKAATALAVYIQGIAREARQGNQQPVKSLNEF